MNYEECSVCFEKADRCELIASKESEYTEYRKDDAVLFCSEECINVSWKTERIPTLE